MKRQECRLSLKTFSLTSFYFAVFFAFFALKKFVFADFTGKRDAYPPFRAIRAIRGF